MRPYLLTALILFSAAPAWAQSYPSNAPQPQQEANVGNYPMPPATYTPPAYNTPQPQATQPQPYYDPRPTDAGQSIVTDVRQMNF